MVDAKEAAHGFANVGAAPPAVPGGTLDRARIEGRQVMRLPSAS